MGRIPAACWPVAITVIAILLLAALAGAAMGWIAIVAGEGDPQVTTDKPSYGGYELVTITGTGFGSEQVLDVPVVRPDGSIVTGDGTETPGFDTVIADADGDFTYYYQLNGYPIGTYTVEVYDNNDTGHETLLASTTFIDGQIQRLELKYRDFGFATSVPPSVDITLIKDKKKGHLDPPGEVGEPEEHGPITVAADGTFAVKNDTGWHDLGSGIELELDNGSETIRIKIHTSCSKPIGIGFIYGDSDETADGPFSPEDPDDDFVPDGPLTAGLEITALTEDSCGDSHVPSIKVCKEVLPEPGVSTWDFTLNWPPPDALNLQTDWTMSTAISPTGNIDINHGQTKYFTATSPVTSASNDTNWRLVLVLRDKPDEETQATITVWWQNGGACSTGPVAGQIFATGSVTVPIASDKLGVSLTVPKTGGILSHTFVSGDLLCMSLSNDRTAGANDIHAYANIASTSGTTGVSRLEGSFTLDTADSYSGLGDGQCHTFINLTPGEYTLAETAQAGYTTSVSCDLGKDSGTDNVTFTLNSAEDVTCTFTNTQQQGTIIIEKQTIPDASTQTFQFTGDVSATLTDGQQASQQVTPGTYTSTEIVPTGWDLTEISCTDTDSSGNLDTKTATFIVDPGETVTCTFTNTQIMHTLTVNVVGSGSVSKNPDQATYTYGTNVQLTATADPGWTFSAWSGDLTGSTNPDTITMDDDKTVTATFIPVEYTLTVNTVGSGSVSRDPDQPTYTYGTVVTLTATADPGWKFDNWSGDCSGIDPSTSVTMDSDKSCTAIFSEVTLPPAVGGVVDIHVDSPYSLAGPADEGSAGSSVPYSAVLAGALAAAAVAIAAGALYARRRWLR